MPAVFVQCQLVIQLASASSSFLLASTVHCGAGRGDLSVDLSQVDLACR